MQPPPVDGLELRLAKLWGPLKAKRYLDIKQVDRDLTTVGLMGQLTVDVGAGICIDALRLAKSAGGFCVAVDLQKGSLMQGKQWADEMGVDGGVDFVIGSALDLPIRNAQSGLTVSYSAIDHLPSKELAQQWLDEMSRITLPGGTVVLTTSNRQWPLYVAFRLAGRLLPSFRQELFFRPSELVAMMTKAGLSPRAFDGRGLFYPYAIRGFSLFILAVGKAINYFQRFSCFKALCSRVGYRATRTPLRVPA
jgi:ubiquinone/menaquinone biosynthesis C-methylase UbiE